LSCSAFCCCLPSANTQLAALVTHWVKALDTFVAEMVISLCYAPSFSLREITAHRSVAGTALGSGLLLHNCAGNIFDWMSFLSLRGGIPWEPCLGPWWVGPQVHPKEHSGTAQNKLGFSSSLVKYPF